MEQLRSTEMLSFGRVTDKGMAAYLQRAHGEISKFMNELPKVVFSRTLDRAEWKNSRLAEGDAASEVRELKNRDEKICSYLAAAACAIP